MEMIRKPGHAAITIGATVGASTEIDLAEFACGSFHLPADSGTTAVTFYAQVGGVAYGIANDEDGVPPSPLSVTAGLPYPLPSFVYQYPRLKLVASSGTATTSVPLFLKS